MLEMKRISWCHAFTRYEVFRRTENLVAVTTGDVASEENKHDLLGTEEIGKTVVK